MVGFWPWRGDASSTASFEKTLSTLSAKITETQARLDKVRASSRRARVLWTLYLSFAYLVYAIVLVLVIGYKNLGTYEWTGLAGGPVLIYVTRTVLTAFYTFRIDSLSARLKDQQQERAKTIQKLKDATKYDSTLELIEKYGGADGKPKGKKDSQGDQDQNLKDRKGGPSSNTHHAAGPGRTRMPPPATANIQHRPVTPQPVTPQPSSSLEPGAEFAPNADFSPSAFTQAPPPPPPSHYTGPHEPHWYDRIFDVLLGEDETAPKNRIVLICKSCRLVNGQAPPGTRSLADVGPWRCMSCSALNGELDEGKRIVNEVLAASAETDAETEGTGEDGSSDAVDVSKEDAEDDANSAPMASVGKLKGKGKKI